jgi:hypothetical protein
MEIEVYCDESRPELFTTRKHADYIYMLIGSIWLPIEKRNDIKKKVRTIREAHSTFGEIKWNNVSPSKINFYKDLVNLFLDESDNVRFRCIVIDSSSVNLKHYHEGDAELGFYKFYYQLLHHWIKEGNQYFIFTDTKTTRFKHRLKELHKILRRSNLFAEINNLQAIPSKESTLIQLADLFTGAVGYCAHRLRSSSAKNEIVSLLSERLKRSPDTSTTRDSVKFNVFRIRLDDGHW